MPELMGRDIATHMDRELEARSLAFREHTGQLPKLAILTDNYEHGPSKTYMGLKGKKAKALEMGVETFVVPNGLAGHIDTLNERDDVHGIIVQLPVKRPEETDHIVGAIAPHKDVDGLGPNALFPPATPLAIVKLLEGHGIDYRQNSVAILGAGRLVGKPLFEMMREAGTLQIEAFDEHSDPLEIVAGINEAQIVVSAMGQPGALTPDLFTAFESEHKVVIDAGVAEQGGVVRGDMAEELRERGLEYEWRVTPEKGGVGPLTIRTLLANTLTAAETQASPAVSV